MLFAVKIYEINTAQQWIMKKNNNKKGVKLRTPGKKKKKKIKILNIRTVYMFMYMAVLRVVEVETKITVFSR